MPKSKAKKLNEFRERVIYGSLLAAISMVAIYFGGIVFNAFAALIAVIMMFEFRSIIWNRKTANRKLWYCIMVIYIVIPVMALVFLRAYNYDATLWLVVTIAGSDIGGYSVGKAWGKHKMAPKISPKKTWEGLAGCCFFAALTSYFYTQMSEYFFIGIILALVSQAGDLTESLIKRYFGVKDSASIIPGHGGFMDRLDGYIYAAPLVLLWQLKGVLAYI